MGLKDEVAKSHPQVNAKESQNLMNQQLKKYHAHISKCAKRLDGLQNDKIFKFSPEGGPNARTDNDPYVTLCAEHLCHLGKRNTTDVFTKQGE